MNQNFLKPLMIAIYINTSKRENDDPGSPLVDYTPPSLLTLLFTDLGILTPSAVSDELINLYL